MIMIQLEILLNWLLFTVSGSVCFLIMVTAEVILLV